MWLTAVSNHRSIYCDIYTVYTCTDISLWQYRLHAQTASDGGRGPYLHSPTDTLQLRRHGRVWPRNPTRPTQVMRYRPVYGYEQI